VKDEREIRKREKFEVRKSDTEDGSGALRIKTLPVKRKKNFLPI